MVLQCIDPFLLIPGFSFHKKEHFYPWMYDGSFLRDFYHISNLKYFLYSSVPLFRYCETRPWTENLRKRQYEKGFLPSSAILHNPPVNDFHYAYVADSTRFRMLLSAIKDDGISVVMYCPPVHESFLYEQDSRERMMDFYYDVAEKLNIPLLDYSNMDIRRDSSYFMDECHLNLKGADCITDSLAKDLSLLLGRKEILTDR